MYVRMPSPPPPKLRERDSGGGASPRNKGGRSVGCCKRNESVCCGRRPLGLVCRPEAARCRAQAPRWQLTQLLPGADALRSRSSLRRVHICCPRANILLAIRSGLGLRNTTAAVLYLPTQHSGSVDQGRLGERQLCTQHRPRARGSGGAIGTTSCSLPVATLSRP